MADPAPHRGIQAGGPVRTLSTAFSTAILLLATTPLLYLTASQPAGHPAVLSVLKGSFSPATSLLLYHYLLKVGHWAGPSSLWTTALQDRSPFYGN